MAKITVREDAALTALQGDAVPTRVTAVLSDGRRISRQVDDVPGFAGRPMQRADVERKFYSNVGKRWPAERTRSVLDAMWGLEGADDLGFLLGKLSV
jgi:2-methylcitrate dehydratase